MKYTNKCEFSTNVYDTWLIGVILLSYFGLMCMIIIIYYNYDYLYRRLRNNTINVQNNMINVQNNTCNVQNNTNTNHESEQIIEELCDTNIICDVENGNTEECLICVTPCKQKYALVPCGHTQMCINCYNKLQQKKCPLCNNQINSIIKIY